MPDISQLSINLATIRMQGGLVELVEACARAGVPAVAPWRDQVASAGLDVSVRAIRDAGLAVSGLCRGGMFPAGTAEGRRAADEDNRRAVDEAVALDAECLVLVVGGLPEGSRDLAGARQMVEDGIGRLLEYSRPAGMKLAIEPLHPMYAGDRSCVNTLGQALDLAGRLGADVGTAIDAYHVWWDPDVAAQIARAGSENRVFAYHICDWLVPTEHLLTDRGMMGDGVIDLTGLRTMIEATGYAGFHEVEIFSAENWWKRPLDEVIATCIERHRESS